MDIDDVLGMDKSKKQVWRRPIPELLNTKFIFSHNNRLFEVNFDWPENTVKVFNDDKELLYKWEYTKGKMKSPEPGLAEWHLMKAIAEK